MFGGLGEMAGLLKKAQEMQKNMKRLQDELAELEISGRSQGGQVEVLLGGDMRVRKVYVNPACIELKDASVLESAILEAVNSAVEQVKAEGSKRLSQATGGLNVPGLFP